MAKNLIITGATGFLGKKLVNDLRSDGYEITVFSRDINKAKSEVPSADAVVEWDYKKPEEWFEHVDGKYGIIHLAGANLGSKRWTEEYKKILYDSRIDSSRSLVRAIKKSNKKPEVLISASAVGYYGERGEEVLTEDSPPGNDFLADLCKDWEDEVNKAAELGVRTVTVRTGVMLSKDEGALERMLLPFKLFVGGPLGNGDQWFPWVHLNDIINIYRFILDNPNVDGAVNASSPIPVKMKAFASILGEVLHRPALFPVPKFALKIAAGEVADYITESQRVIPKKLEENNYEFEFVEVKEALEDILK
jgi:uncharacterized protein